MDEDKDKKNEDEVKKNLRYGESNPGQPGAFQQAWLEHLEWWAAI